MGVPQLTKPDLKGQQEARVSSWLWAFRRVRTTGLQESIGFSDLRKALSSHFVLALGGLNGLQDLTEASAAVSRPSWILKASKLPFFFSV